MWVRGRSPPPVTVLRGRELHWSSDKFQLPSSSPLTPSGGSPIPTLRPSSLGRTLRLLLHSQSRCVLGSDVRDRVRGDRAVGRAYLVFKFLLVVRKVLFLGSSFGVRVPGRLTPWDIMRCRYVGTRSGPTSVLVSRVVVPTHWERTQSS